MGEPEEDRDRSSTIVHKHYGINTGVKEMPDDYNRFGQLIWEASKKFNFIKVQVADSVLGNGGVIIQFGMMHKGHPYVHSEIFTMDTVKDIPDPKTVIDAIHLRMMKEHSMKAHYR